MNRRKTLVGIATVFSAGCSTRFIAVDDPQPGIVEAVAVEEKPPDAEATPRKEIENPSVREAVEKACDNEESETQVRVSGDRVEGVKEQLHELPAYSPPSGSEYESGNYVECDGRYVVVRLLIED